MAERGQPSEAIPQSAVDAAAALLAEEAAELSGAAPESPPSDGRQEVQPAPQERPRAADGRFAPRQAPAPSQEPPREAQPPQPQAQQPPAQPEDAPTDYKALYEAEQAERARAQAEMVRLQNIYNHNTTTQREALQAAREEARVARENVRQQVQAERDGVLAEMRQVVANMDPRDPDRADAVLNLARLERSYFEKAQQEWRDEVAARQKEEEDARQAQERATFENAEATAKIAAWGTLEGYGQKMGPQLNLAPQQVQAILSQFKTRELGDFIARQPSDRVVDLIVNDIGERFHQALVAHAGALAESNRQAAINDGAHVHQANIQHQPSAPAYQKYQWGGDHRLGVEAAAMFLIEGGLDGDE